MRSARTGCVSAVFCVALASSLSQSSAWTSGVSSRTSQRSLHSQLLFRTTDDDDDSSADERGATFLVPGRPRPKRESTPTQAPVKRKTKRQLSTMALTAQRRELLNHELLTREEELDLGRMVNQANKLRSSISQLVEEKKAALQQQNIKQIHNIDKGGVINEDLFYSSFDGFNDSSFDSEDALFHPDGSPSLCGEFFLENYYQNQMELGIHSRVDDLELLSEDDIISRLDKKGGRAELQRILLEGAFARDKLIRSNIRLVASIAKRWARHSAKYDSQDGAKLVTIYEGNASRPSLEEAIQEGILGLARAADRYDPSRGLRFSTYSTYWVTNFIRNCFRDATTGSLRIPYDLHRVRSDYKTLLKTYYDSKTEIPPEETIAAELGISVNRLRTARLATQPLLSIDGPLMANAGAPSKGSNAGSDVMGGNELLISDTLQCSEARPEDQVELSFLRQCLENAMSAELSPHERDVIRLRLGLDDGVTRSAREVVEVCGGTVSVSEVRLTEQRAFKKLRAPYLLQNYQLIAFLDFAGIDQSSLKR